MTPENYCPNQTNMSQTTYETYLELVPRVTNFLNRNSFAAEGRRRTSTATGVGVTLEDIRNHFLKFFLFFV